MLFGLRVFYDNSNAIVSIICSRNTATALCVEMWALLNPMSRRLASGVVSLVFLSLGVKKYFYQYFHNYSILKQLYLISHSFLSLVLSNHILLGIARYVLDVQYFIYIQYIVLILLLF